MVCGYFADIRSAAGFVLTAVRPDDSGGTTADASAALTAVIQVVVIVLYVRSAGPIRNNADQPPGTSGSGNETGAQAKGPHTGNVSHMTLRPV